MKRVFITRRLPACKALLEPHFEVVARDENSPCPADTLAELIHQFDGVICTVSDSFSRSVLGDGGRLRVLSNYAVGLDNIDVQRARELGIAVCNTPDVVTAPTADLTMALLLAVARKICSAREFVRQGAWKRWDPELLLGETLEGKTLGVIGFGKIGQAVARRVLGFGMSVRYHVRTKARLDADLAGRVQQVDLTELLNVSDFISLHVPLNAETANLLSDEVFRQMRKRPVVINMSRGGVVDTEALIAALENGQIRAAALDVTSPEPLPSGSPLLTMENCLIVPHIGTATEECRQAMGTLAARNILEHFGVDL